MSIQEKSSLYAKETSDLGVVQEKIFEGIANKKNVMEIITSEIQPAIDAAAGFDQVDDELRENPVVFCETIGASIGRSIGHIVAARMQAVEAKIRAEYAGKSEAPQA